MFQIQVEKMSSKLTFKCKSQNDVSFSFFLNQITNNFQQCEND